MSDIKQDVRTTSPTTSIPTSLARQSPCAHSAFIAESLAKTAATRVAARSPSEVIREVTGSEASPAADGAGRTIEQPVLAPPVVQSNTQKDCTTDALITKRDRHRKCRVEDGISVLEKGTSWKQASQVGKRPTSHRKRNASSSFDVALVILNCVHTDANNRTASKTRRTAQTPKPTRATRPTTALSKRVTAIPMAMMTRKAKRDLLNPCTSSTTLNPKPLNAAVKAQVKLVHEFLRQVDKDDTVLERDPHTFTLIIIPESALLAAVISMRLHYEVGSQDKASISEVQESIVGRFAKPFGEHQSIDVVVLDTTIDTGFVRNIRTKIAGHGLEGKNLLEIELEILKRELLKSLGLRESWRDRTNELLKDDDPFP